MLAIGAFFKLAFTARLLQICSQSQVPKKPVSAGALADIEESPRRGARQSRSQFVELQSERGGSQQQSSGE